jgi:hypothetical protein
MKHLSRLFQCSVLVGLLSVTVLAQSDGASPTAPASGGARIAGTVNVDGKPASGIVLMLYSPDNNNGAMVFTFNMGRSIGEVKARAVTDSQGRYAFNDLTPAKYIVFPFGPTLAAAPVSGSLLGPGKSLSVDAGESVDGMDFSMSRGGVITGKVTQPDGRPAVAVNLAISLVDQQGVALDMATGGFRWPPATDDRGIYRIFGLSPGRYTVCAQPRLGVAASSKANACYQGATDETRGGVVAVAAGEEITNVDIALGQPGASYEAVGGAVDDSGKPVPGANYYCQAVSDDGKNTGGVVYNQSDRTDEKGQFRIQRLSPGRYAVSLTFDSPSNYYSDASSFEVADSNVSGIQVKVHSAASIAGDVAVDGNEDPQVLAQLPTLGFTLYSYGATSSPFGNSQSMNPFADGSFQVMGLAPGTVNFRINPSSSPNGFSLLRVEQNGVPQPSGVPVSAGQQVTGVRLVLSYGTGVLRGQIGVVGGTLPSGTLVRISAQPISGSPGALNSGVADSRGRFEIDGLSDGQYQVAASWLINSMWASTQQKQIVTVSGGQAPETKIVLDLTQKQ